jgi:hypothetical protein
VAIASSLVGFATALLGIGFGISTVRRMHRWPRVPAQLIAATVVPSTEGTSWGIQTRVKFEYDEHTVERTIEPKSYRAQEDDAKEKVVALERATAHQVAINPARPTELLLDPEPGSWFLRWIFGDIIAAVVGVCILLSSGFLWAMLIPFDRWNTKLIPPVFIAVGAILLVATVVVFWQAAMQSRWPTVLATVENVDVAQQIRGAWDDRGRSLDLYAPRARVRYAVNGRQYRPYVTGAFSGGSGAWNHARQEIEQWRRQGELLLHYNAKNPAEFYLHNDAFVVSLVLLGMALFFGVVGSISRHWVAGGR